MYMHVVGGFAGGGGVGEVGRGGSRVYWQWGSRESRRGRRVCRAAFRYETMRINI